MTNELPLSSAPEAQGDGIPYITTDYYSTADYQLVCNAHQALARQHRAEKFDTIGWYWKTAKKEEPGQEYHKESVGPFTLHSSPLKDMPFPLVAIYMDSQIKTYMDRDTLGDAVRQRTKIADEKRQQAIRAAREAELARRIGGESLQGSDVQIAMVEYCGYIVSGMMINPGKKDKTVAAIMQSPSERATAMAALQAQYTLPAEDPFLAQKENEIVDLIRYFRTPDHVLKKILSPHLLQRKSYRRTVQLIRALTISEVFAVTKRWMERNGREITTGVCETPNKDVKLLIEGRKVKTPDGKEVRVGGIPHRVVTAATGAELYPAYYENRPEGKTKIYTLYAFDFGQIALQAKAYRAQATTAYGGLSAHGIHTLFAWMIGPL
jgi:hypothetical protein